MTRSELTHVPSHVLVDAWSTVRHFARIGTSMWTLCDEVDTSGRRWKLEFTAATLPVTCLWCAGKGVYVER